MPSSRSIFKKPASDFPQAMAERVLSRTPEEEVEGSIPPARADWILHITDNVILFLGASLLSEAGFLNTNLKLFSS